MSAFVALGGNVGTDREILGRFRAAVRAIEALDQVDSVELSRVYRSAPVGPVRDQPAFLNAVVRVELHEPAPAAEALLAELLAIEAALGRVRDARGGPRTIDLDLLLVDGQQQHTARLTLPHPRLAERAFVLLPLIDLLGRAWRVPVLGEQLGELSDRALLTPGQACDVAAMLDDDDQQSGDREGEHGI